MNKNICIITSSAHSVLQFRLDLIKEILEKKTKVSVVSFDNDENCKSVLSNLGVDFYTLDSDRTSIGVIDNFSTVVKLYKLLKNMQPDVVLTYFIKPNIFAILVSYILGIRHRVMLLEGLGYIFTEQTFIVRYILKNLVLVLYIMAFNLSSKIIVLNDTDEEFTRKKILDKRKIVKISGIGVNLEKYFKIDGFNKKYDFVFVGRYLKHKGINEFFTALKILKTKGYEFNAAIVGSLDNNPSSLTQVELNDLMAEGLVEDLGYQEDTNIIYNLSKVLVLPSYREARPRVVQEALVCGLPCIVSNAPGCFDSITHGVTGLVVKVQDEYDLAAAMETYLTQPNTYFIHAQNACSFGKAIYDVKAINKIFLTNLLSSDEETFL